MAQVEKESASDDTPSLKFKREDLRPYRYPKGKVLQTGIQAIALVSRGLLGTLIDGYSLSFNGAEDDKDKPFAALGLPKVREYTEKIATYKRPAQPIQLYEFEACPFCRKVREITAMLDLDVMMYPSPTGNEIHRKKVVELGGKAQFPYMVDPNTGVSMYESSNIVEYLCKEYGSGNVPLLSRLPFITMMTLTLCTLLRLGRGISARKARYPEKPLVLWGYEGSPFVKYVRELLCELGIPYLYRNCARGSNKRMELLNRVNHFQVPFLEDPNTGAELFESTIILDYVERTYALPA